MDATEDRKMDAITARAQHDPEMRDILSDIGIFESDPDRLRDALDTLPMQKKFELFDSSDDLEKASGRSNDAYMLIGDFAQQRWVELMAQPKQVAQKINDVMPAAKRTIETGNTEQYGAYQQQFAERGAELNDAVTEARNTLRRDIRSEVKASGLDYDTATRGPLVEHLTRSAPVPAEVTDAIGAAGRLENAKMRYDSNLERQRHLGAELSSQRAGMSM